MECTHNTCVHNVMRCTMTYLKHKQAMDACTILVYVSLYMEGISLYVSMINAAVLQGSYANFGSQNPDFS